MVQMAMNRGVMIMMGLLMVAIILAFGTGRSAAPASVAAQASQGEPPGLSVVGDGAATARPDQATLSTGVQVTRASPSEALAEASRVTEVVLAKLDELGIPRTSVQTSGLSIFPVYDNSPRPGGGEPPIVGYRAGLQMTIVIANLDQVGRVIDGVVGAGANQVGGLRFGIRDEAALRHQALQEAFRVARAKADILAGAAGAKVGAVLVIREDSASTPIPLAQPAEAAPRAGLPIEGGQLTVRARIQVVFAIQ